MKPFKFVFLLVLLTMTGCATSNYTFGTNFPSENVSKIVKGETTTSELVQLFGQPFSKSVINDKDEKWLYSYSQSTATAQSYVFTMDVKTSGLMKSLDVLVREGVVVNFTYTEGPLPSSMIVN